MIDDGTITRLGENDYRWTAADPSLRWFQQNALGSNVHIEDISEQIAALALQGPTSGRLLKAVADANVADLKYFRVTHGRIAGVPVDISRTGYTGDLGFEIWMPWKDALRVWDKLMNEGEVFDIHPAGMVALDIARIEAGLILIEVDYTSSKKAVIDSQRYSPAEIGLGKLVDLKKENFVGRDALVAERKKGAARALVGLEIDWNEVEALYDKIGMAPQVPSTASRVAVPVYRGGRVIGKATSTTWSPTLKKMIALACVERHNAAVGTTLNIEMTVEAVRHTVSAKVVPTAVLQSAAQDCRPDRLASAHRLFAGDAVSSQQRTSPLKTAFHPASGGPTVFHARNTARIFSMLPMSPADRHRAERDPRPFPSRSFPASPACPEIRRDSSSPPAAPASATALPAPADPALRADAKPGTTYGAAESVPARMGTPAASICFTTCIDRASSFSRSANSACVANSSCFRAARLPILQRSIAAHTSACLR